MNDVEALVQATADAASSMGCALVRAGVDRVELDEFRRTVEVAGQAFLDRVFTPAELTFADSRVDRLADRFAAKEAVAKVLGTGFRGLAASEIEIVTSARGEPSAVLRGRAERRAHDIGLASLAVSMTNTSICAEAFAIGLCIETSEQIPPGKENGHA